MQNILETLPFVLVGRDDGGDEGGGGHGVPELAVEANAVVERHRVDGLVGDGDEHFIKHRSLVQLAELAEVQYLIYLAELADLPDLAELAELAERYAI